MGTRSNIMFYEWVGKNKLIYANIFQMFNGYPSGVGRELIEWLNQFEIHNGIQLDAEGKVISNIRGKRIANGLDCLSAQYVADHKKEIGNLYLVDACNFNERGYVYLVTLKDGKLYVTCESENKIVFTGFVIDLVKVLDCFEN